MRPKTRGLAQHGSPPGWLEESDPWHAGSDFVPEGRSIPPTLMDHGACPDLGLLSCEHLAISASSVAGLLLNAHLLCG